MASDQIGVYVPVSEVFPSVRGDFAVFKSLLRDLSLTDTLFWCARLNLVISDSSAVDHLTRQQFGLNQFLTTEEINAVNNFVQKHGGAQNVTVFFRDQILELIRWVALYCQDYPEDGTTFEDLEIRRKFVQAALIASDVWAQRVFGNRFSVSDGVDTGRKRALGAIRKSIQTKAPSPARSLGRGWTLFKDYFSRHCQSFEDEFRSSTSLSVEEYYICLSAIIANFLDPQKGSGIFDSNTIGNSTPCRDLFQKYLGLESQSIDELRDALWSHFPDDISCDEDIPPYDYRPLREKPILRAQDGRAIVLDPVFYSEKAFVGPLFLLVARKSKGKVNELFGAFGNAFERYACDILERMFPDISGAVTKRLSCNIHGTDQKGNEIEIDACLNDIIEMVLFEMKAVWIREDEILTENHERYLQHLRKKYSVTRGTSRKRKSKGIGQLVRVIKTLASKEWLGPNQEFSQVQLIYPVLVAHDSLLAVPVYGSFFASEFKTLLSPDAELPSGELKKGHIRIAPLIVMTIRVLEDLETSIEHFGFRDLLADYSRSCPDRLTSLHDFIAFSDYKNKMFFNRSLAAKGMEILQKSLETVFPAGSDESG